MKTRARYFHFLSRPDKERPEVAQVRTKILNNLLLVLSLLGIPAALMGIVQSYTQGRWVFSLLYGFIYAIFLIGTFARKHLQYKTRAWILVSTMFLFSIAVLVRLGMSGVGLQFLLGVCFTAALLLGLRVGLVVVLVSVAGVISIAIGMVSGVIEILPEHMLTSTSLLAWITGLFVFLTMVTITISAPEMLYWQIEKSMNLLEEEKSNSDAANRLLRREIDIRRKTEEALQASNEQMQAQFDSLVASERSLRESEGKYRKLTETAHDVIVSVDLNWKITYANRATLNIAGGMNPVGMSLLNFTPRNGHELQEAIMQKRREGFSDVLSFEWEINLPAGKKALFEISAALLTDNDKPSGVLFVARDITERKRAEEELRRLSTAIEQAAEDIIITDPEGVIQYVNPAFEKITGYSRLEAIGKTPRILKSGLHDASFYEHIWETIKSGHIWTGRVTNRCKNGELIYEDASICPLLTSTGMLTGYVSLKRDVTDALRLENQLRQSQKMESIGTLAGGIAHDFNNILGALMGYASLAKLKTKDEKIASYLSQVLQGCDRARDLVKQILTFSRQSVQEKKPIMLIPLIKEVAKFMRASLPATIEIEQKINVSSDVVMADATQIHQLMMNLCMNAGHAMKEKGGLLEIAVEEVRIGEEKQYAALPHGQYLQLTVRDTGHGIEERHLEKIFEPYFTTKQQGGGTGLGLSVVDGIVKSHGGAIKVYSEVGKGTVFHVYIKLIEDKTDIHDEKEINTLPGGRETILLVDDEEMLVQVNKLMLEELGYKVVAETDPGKAIELLRTEGDGFDLVITDKTMPHITGFDLAREIKGIRNDIPIIICSGFQDKEDAAKIAALGISHFIAKPIKLALLANAIRDVLDKKSG